MATNDFKPFATGAGANVMSQSDYQALEALITGFQSGKASSAQVNKALRQATFISSALAQFVADKTGLDVLDDGDLSAFVAKLTNGFGKQFLSRSNPFADIKSDGVTAVALALSNLSLKEAAKRDVGTGANQIPDMSAYELVGNSSNGYLKLPNGFKYQWLETSGQVSAGTTGAGYWTYPFTLCLFAFALPVAVSANPVAGNIVAGAFSNSAVELHNWGQISAKARIIGFGR
ncbi:phage tail protein [Atlantibacter hermannii]|uniref:phage tail protein n=1 Tax=Atlantibacter hermannii TaxID=565 RepID=UPI00289F287D|nr:phage tail protein [Atlantibacter hermannii]